MIIKSRSKLMQMMMMMMVMMTTMAQVRVCTNMTNNPDMLTDRELEEVTAVFKSFETGLREATIHPKVFVCVFEFLYLDLYTCLCWDLYIWITILVHRTFTRQCSASV